MAHGLGANRARFFSTSEEVIKDVSSGRSVIGYNVLGSYALDEAARNPELGVVFPADYTLVMSRIAMIPTTSGHPNAARLFLDFLLRSEEHTSELQSLMRISYAVFCLKKKTCRIYYKPYQKIRD